MFEIPLIVSNSDDRRTVQTLIITVTDSVRIG